MNRIRHLPVVDNGRVVGVVSIGDLVKWINPFTIAETESVNGFTNAEARFGTAGPVFRFETTPEPAQGSVQRGSQYEAKTRQNVTSWIGHTWRFLSPLNRNGNPAGVCTENEIRQHLENNGKWEAA